VHSFTPLGCREGPDLYLLLFLFLWMAKEKSTNKGKKENKENIRKRQ
jgi:hypothetical protein